MASATNVAAPAHPQAANGAMTFQEALAQGQQYKMVSWLDPGKPQKPIVVQNRRQAATATRVPDLPLTAYYQGKLLV